MAIVIPILTEYNGRGMKSAIAEINRADSTFAQVGTAARLAGMAMIGAAAGAGVLAGKLAVDSVKAAMEDQAALESLSRTMDSIGGAGQQSSVEAYISRLQRATGTADTELRPAMERLLRSTKDVGESERLLALAMDVSAGTHKSLQQTVDALGSAYDGNFGKLGKLQTGLSAATLATKDLGLITGELSGLFSGAAATAASTMQGKADRVTTALSEMSEVIGYSLLDALDELSNSMGGPDAAIDQIEQTGDALSSIIDISTTAIAKIYELIEADKLLAEQQRDTNAAGEGANGWVEFLISKIPLVGGAYVELMNGQQRAAEAANANAGAIGAEAARYTGLANAARQAANAILAANAARANKAVADRYTALARSFPGTSISFTGGNLSTYFDEVDTVTNAFTGGSSGSGGSTVGLTPAQKNAQAAFDALSDSVAVSKTALDSVGRSLADARKKLIDYANATRAWLVSGINIGDAVQTWMEDVAKVKELDAKIAEAIAAEDEKGAARLQAERAGINTAASWWDGFQQQIADSKAAAAAIEQLVATLNPADSLGNELLLDQIRGMKPAEALAAIDFMVKNSLGPSAAAALSETFGGAGQVGTAIATAFYGSGVTAAENQYNAIKGTLEGKLEALYALGKSMGDKVAAGWNAAVANLPADVRLPSGSTVVAPQVTVNAGVGDPVAIAKSVADVIAQAARRTR